jgi:hypothetical protein
MASDAKVAGAVIGGCAALFFAYTFGMVQGSRAAGAPMTAERAAGTAATAVLGLGATSPAPQRPVATESPALAVVSDAQAQKFGRTYIVGEVVNNDQKPLRSIKIIATFYDDAGKVIGTNFSYATLDVVAPGAKSPFEISAADSSGFKRYALAVEGRAG